MWLHKIDFTWRCEFDPRWSDVVENSCKSLLFGETKWMLLLMNRSLFTLEWIEMKTDSAVQSTWKTSAVAYLDYASNSSDFRTHHDGDDQAKLIVKHLHPFLYISSYPNRAEFQRLILIDEESDRFVASKHQWIELDDQKEKSGRKIINSSFTTTSRTKKKFQASSTSSILFVWVVDLWIRDSMMIIDLTINISFEIMTDETSKSNGQSRPWTEAGRYEF